MKPGKHQRSKQRCKDLCWKVHDRAQSFVLRSYTMHELRHQHVSILVSSLVRNKQLLYFVHGQGPKREQKHTTKNFVGFHNHSLLLTMVAGCLKGLLFYFFSSMLTVKSKLGIAVNLPKMRDISY